jgi:hypothetical protein
MQRLAAFTFLASIALASASGCSHHSSSDVVATPDGGSAGTSGEATNDDLGPGDPGPGGVRFAASGEVLALTGYAFPPASDDAPVFVDGWEVKFEHVLVTVDKVTLSENPDSVPGDQSKTGGVVAQISGPWAIDLAWSDPTYLPGKGGPGELAVPFASIKTSSLKTDGTRYAFGFDLVPASAGAKMVNVTGDGATAYAKMVTDGCAVRYIGTSTFKGNKADAACNPADRQGWPDAVAFDLCFKTPTTYVNCQNPDNDPAKPLGDEEHQRGLPLKSDASVIAQITIHVDHPFWDSVLHDTPTHFDQFAARVVGRGPSPTVTLDALKGVDYTAYTDAAGKPLTWRYCVEPPTDVHAKFVGPMKFDPQSVPHAAGSDPASGLRDYYDFALYNQSTQGHLNSDGLCSVKRNYPSPP